MTVSVITATYNSSATVEDTLSSVASQDYSRIEHIIIDGMSKDDTIEIVNRFPHVSRKVSEKDRGIYDAMNKGILLASGDIIGILNSDDFYASQDVISKVVRAFNQTDCDAVYGDLVYVDKEHTDKVTRYWRSGSYKPGSFMWGWMPPHPTLFVRKVVYERFGLFDLELKTAADYELMLRFIHKHGIKLHYIPEVLVRMRSGGASNASFQRRLDANRADQKAWKKNGLRPYWFTVLLKPVRKIGQFLRL